VGEGRRPVPGASPAYLLNVTTWICKVMIGRRPLPIA